VIASICLSTVVLLGRVASRPVIGRRLPPSNSTQITDGCRVGHDGVGHNSCCVSDAITHDERPQYIISVKLARSEATWRLVF